MPIFEYKCRNCGERIEVLEKQGKTGVRVCPYCGSSCLGKLLSRFSAQTKSGSSNRCQSCTDYKCPRAGA